MTHFNWLSYINSHITHENLHIASAFLVVTLITVIAIAYQRKRKKNQASLVPSGKVTLTNILEVTVQELFSLVEGIIGPTARDYFPLLGSLFIYIFISNLLGIIPGMLPPTDNINTNLACALVVFFYYNIMGIRRQGFKHYMAHFMGPIIWLAPLMFIIEIIGHLVRPLSLSLRLFGNITGDHVVLGIFSSLTPFIVPVIFMALGIFVSFIQAFVFTLLSTIYIALAVAGQEEHH